MDKDCLAYLFKTFKEFSIKEREMTEEECKREWDRMPDDNKQMLVDLVTGYKPGTNSPLLSEIMAEYNKKTHSDTSFGMTVKALINKHK